MKIGTSSLHQTSLSMQKLDSRHINKNESSAPVKDVEGSFADMFLTAVNSVNQDQLKADSLQQDAVIAPDAVNVSDILIATEKARLSVSMLKSITERASRAYTEIMNIR